MPASTRRPWPGHAERRVVRHQPSPSDVGNVEREVAALGYRYDDKPPTPAQAQAQT